MKINKDKLKQIILEEFEMLESKDDETKLINRAMSTSQRQQTVRDRIKGQGEEFTTTEQGLVDQLEDFISKLASEPGVDLVQHRPLLQRVLKLLQKQIKGAPDNNKDQNNGNSI
tara:strand:- start:157 stop:498 length:342 start_codon:yes stop_codon:yes gene_type:complete